MKLKSVELEIGDNVRLVQRGKRGNWTADIRVGNKHTRKALKTRSFEVARRRAIELQAQITGGTSQISKKRTKVREAVDALVRQKESIEHRKRRTILALKRKLGMLVEHCDAASIRFVDQLQTQHLTGTLNDHAEEHDAVTLYNTSIVIKGFGNWLEQNDYLERNPFAKLRLREPPPRPKFVPTTVQVKAMLDQASGQRRVQLAVMGLAGLRAEEVEMLRPVDVDLAEGFIHVRERPGWSPKTYERRSVPIHPLLLSMLNEVNDSLPAARSYFFTSEPNPVNGRSGPRIQTRNLLLYAQRIASSLGMPVKRDNAGYVNHSLRHHFETATVDSGVPQVVVDCWMGHRGKSMGAVYYRLHAEKSQRYMENVRFW